MRITRHRSLRLIGWVVAYALAINTILAGVAGLHAKAATAGGDLVAALCLTAASSTDSTNDAHPNNDHCASCFLVTALDLPHPAAIAQPVAYALAAESHAHEAERLAASASPGRPGLPRAPPSLA